MKQREVIKFEGLELVERRGQVFILLRLSSLMGVGYYLLPLPLARRLMAALQHILPTELGKEE